MARKLPQFTETEHGLKINAPQLTGKAILPFQKVSKPYQRHSLWYISMVFFYPNWINHFTSLPPFISHILCGVALFWTSSTSTPLWYPPIALLIKIPLLHIFSYNLSGSAGLHFHRYHICLYVMLEEAWKGCQTFRKWSYRWLWAIMYLDQLFRLLTISYP